MRRDDIPTRCATNPDDRTRRSVASGLAPHGNGTQMLQPELTQVSLDLVGEFDAYDLESLREVLDGLLGLKEAVYVDLSGVSFLDVRCARELAIRSMLYGGRLVLRNPSWQAVSSLRACGYGHGSLRSELERPGV
jgi:anti-anti-sigma regulatory factor